MRTVNYWLAMLAVVSLLFSGCTSSDPTSPVDDSSGTLYVLNQADQTIHLYDAGSLSLQTSFTTPVVEPHFVEFSPDGEYYYVIGRQPGGLLAKYRASDNSLVDTVRVEGAIFPTALVISADGDTAYVCDFSNDKGRTHRYDVSGTGFVFIDSSLQAGYQTHDMDMAGGGTYFVSVGYNSDDITVVDLATGSVQPFLISNGQGTFGAPPASYGPYGVLVDQSELRAILACRKGVDQIRVVSLISHQVVDSIVVPVDSAADASGEAMAGPTLMALSLDNDTLFATGYTDNRLYVFSLSAGSVVTTVDFAAARPFTVLLSDDESRVYVSCAGFRPDAGWVYVLDGSTFAKLDSVAVGSEPFGIYWRPN